MIEETANEEFSSLIDRYGLVQADGSAVSADEMRAHFLDHRPAGSTAAMDSMTLSWGEEEIAAASLMSYVEKGADVLFEDAALMDGAWLLFSIVPVAQCSINSAQKAINGQDGAVSEAVCFAADVLLFTPLWPLGIVVGFFASLDSPSESASVSYLSSKREQGWQETYRQIKAHISSNKFRTDLRKRFTEEIGASLFILSRQTGINSLAYVGASKAPAAEQNQLEQEIDRRQDRAERQACDRIQHSQRRFENDIANDIRWWVASLSHEYYRHFIKNYYDAAKKTGYLTDHPYDAEDIIRKLWDVQQPPNLEDQENEIYELVKREAMAARQPDHGVCVDARVGSADAVDTDSVDVIDGSVDTVDASSVDAVLAEIPSGERAQPGIASDLNCNGWIKVEDGEGCDTVALRSGARKGDVVRWNSPNDWKCGSLWGNRYACVSVA
ncbi:hypothetical protein CDD83_7158 [Cordyceps sp. RAO-2017]|nr:hypothetical protein CDD83_7158 [Cordyceps sp. RAO-2017]